jgi:hypothetical protein
MVNYFVINIILLRIPIYSNTSKKRFSRRLRRSLSLAATSCCRRDHSFLRSLPAQSFVFAIVTFSVVTFAVVRFRGRRLRSHSFRDRYLRGRRLRSHSFCGRSFSRWLPAQSFGLAVVTCAAIRFRIRCLLVRCLRVLAFPG